MFSFAPRPSIRLIADSPRIDLPRATAFRRPVPPPRLLSLWDRSPYRTRPTESSSRDGPRSRLDVDLPASRRSQLVHDSSEMLRVLPLESVPRALPWVRFARHRFGEHDATRHGTVRQRAYSNPFLFFFFVQRVQAQRFACGINSIGTSKRSPSSLPTRPRRKRQSGPRPSLNRCSSAT